MNSCNDCSCIENYNDQSKFCGRYVKLNGKKTLIGCDEDCCPECPRIKYNNNYYDSLNNKSSNNKSSNNKSSNSSTVSASRPKPLTKQAFLKFLKKQRAQNTVEGILPPIALEEPIPDPVEKEHNNANANHDNLNETPVPFRKEECTEDKGYQWNKEAMLCEELTVAFYTQDGESGSHFELKKGNYDESEIKNFEFKPAFMAVPMGLRVKIWNKSGFVGPSSGYLGNNSTQVSKKNLYPIKNLGSIQICNMKTCVKPNGFDDMTLISVIDGNNIDFVENNVSNLGEYKEKLREKIHRKLLDIRFTHKDCLELVSKYLASKDVDINIDISSVSNAFTLQKNLYELTELPSCQNLINKKSVEVITPEINNNIINNIMDDGFSFHPMESLMEKISPIPMEIKKQDSYENLSSPSSSFETNNVSFIIFIFVFLLITLLVSALIYFYFHPN
jgi:hypothetical protein